MYIIALLIRPYNLADDYIKEDVGIEQNYMKS